MHFDCQERALLALKFTRGETRDIIVLCDNIANTFQILYAYEDEMGEDVIASLDFWGGPQSPRQ